MLDACILIGGVSFCSHSSTGINRIVQITNVPMAGGSGGFKPFKGRF